MRTVIGLWRELGVWGRFVFLAGCCGTGIWLLYTFVFIPFMTWLSRWVTAQVKEALAGDEDEDENGDEDGEDENGDEPDPEGLKGNGGGQLPFDSTLTYIGRAELQYDLERRPGRARKR